jgi:hypothetical protein
MASLTPTPIDSIEPTLRDYGAALRDAPPVARRVWQRIADSRHHRDGDAACWHADAVALCAALGMNPTARAPQDWLSWDGNAVATLTEPSVLIHEVAHFQLASPARRFMPDFCLGAGPESGRIAYADAHKALDAERREIEEQRTSLLGVIWETELGQPAILAFQEQNWLEGAGRPSTADFFVERLSDLIRLGLVDAAHGRPLLALRCLPD